MAEVTTDTRRLPRWHWVDQGLWLLVPVALMLGLHLAGRQWSHGALVLAWLLLAAVMQAGLWRRALSRRQAFLAAYLHADSRWRWRLRGGLLLWLRQALQALLLALVLGVAVVRTQQEVLWWLLAATLPAIVVVQAVCERLLARHAAPRYLPELAMRVTLAALFLLLFAVVTLLALHAPYPDYGEVGLRQALWHAMQAQQAHSPWLEALLQGAAAKDALVNWLGQQHLPGSGSPMLRIGGWLVLLAANGLFVWSYLVACAGALTLARRRIDPVTRSA
ncbi:hypothetical protein [Isoalcanivorax indicus]|uniref:hypothetical protein n=1 Tax=Isoalcanivorax indicus TaxID=2202653 RepID=UPI000DBA51AE|nr:hypothetical protein [Isoalcanivorax indicus]